MKNTSIFPFVYVFCVWISVCYADFFVARAPSEVPNPSNSTFFFSKNAFHYKINSRYSARWLTAKCLLYPILAFSLDNQRFARAFIQVVLFFRYRTPIFPSQTPQLGNRETLQSIHHPPSFSSKNAQTSSTAFYRHPFGIPPLDEVNEWGIILQKQQKINADCR